MQSKITLNQIKMFFLFLKVTFLWQISGPQGGKYEDESLLRYSAQLCKHKNAIKIRALRHIVKCTLGVGRRFRRAYYFRHQGDEIYHSSP
jgi:hypothetical protein